MQVTTATPDSYEILIHSLNTNAKYTFLKYPFFNTMENIILHSMQYVAYYIINNN